MTDQGAGFARLPGEDLSSVLHDDAQHWSNVYEELVNTLAALLNQLKREGVTIELAPLQAQHEQALRRLRLWRQRAQSLSQAEAAQAVAQDESTRQG